MPTTAPHVREYWYGGIEMPEGTLWRAEHSWTTARLSAHRYADRYSLVRSISHAGTKKRLRIVHVTILPRGSRRVVEAARKIEASWGVKLTRGEAQRALTGLFAAVRAQGGE